MTLVDVGIVSLLTAVMMAAMRYREQRMSAWITAGSTLTSAAWAMLTLNAVLNRDQYPGFPHLLLQVGWSILGIGIMKDAGPYQRYLKPRVILTLVMIASAWMMMLCSLFLSAHSGPRRTLVTAVLFCEVVNVTLIALLFADRRVAGMGILCAGQTMLVAADAVAAGAHLAGTAPPHAWRAGLALVGICSTAFGLAVMRHDLATPPASDIDAERLPGIITSALLGIPLAVVIAYAAQGRGIDDAWNAIFGFVVILSYAGREFYRSRQNRCLMLQLSEQARRDPLTGLRNRRALANTMREVSHNRTAVTVVTLDVDRFKEINRQLGHSSGDAVLIRLAHLLEERGFGDCFRLGGDEFCVVSTLTQSATVLEAEELRRAARSAFEAVPGVESLAITVSLGLARYQPDSAVTDAMEVLSQSTQALRMAKSERNRVRVYSEADAAQEQYRAVVEQRLRAALARDEITFCYQPIVTLDDNRVIAFESLARWTDPTLGVVSPAEFVPIAEDTGLIHGLGMLALRRACTISAGLHRAGHSVTISVNVSPVQLRRPSFDHELEELLASVDCEADWITLEVTEGIFMDLDDPAVLTLFRLSAMGITVAIDDFGSGYSSFGYMARLPVRVVKIDRSLVHRVDRPKARSVIEALLTVAATHGLRVVVEGVETPQEARQLRRLGATTAQGWLWSPGVREDEIQTLLIPQENRAATPS